MQRSHLIALAMALQAATAFAPSERTWAADAVPARTPRGKVRIEGLVLPDFPEDLVKPGAPVEVRIRLDLDEGGRVTHVDVKSPPSPVDDEVAKVARRWWVIPDVCAGGKLASQSVETKVIFSLEDGKQMITIKEPHRFAVGPDEPPLRSVTANELATVRVKMQEPLAIPIYPRNAIRRGISYGIAVGVVHFDGTGKAVDLVRLYQWPVDVFERSIRDAVLQWHADADDPYVKAGKAFDSCFKANFSLN